MNEDLQNFTDEVFKEHYCIYGYNENRFFNLPKDIPLVWKMNPRCKSDDIKSALITWKEKYGD